MRIIPTLLLIGQMAFVSQQSRNDCVTAALATMAGTSYDAIVAIERGLGMEPKDTKTGRQIIQLAAELGIQLELKPYSSTAEGIVVVRDKKGSDLHAVFVDGKFVYDPSDSKPRVLGDWHPAEVAYFLEANR